ncbi:MAG: hypothetical protein AB7F89_27755 [Pirellulaceae bacterium]
MRRPSSARIAVIAFAILAVPVVVAGLAASAQAPQATPFDNQRAALAASIDKTSNPGEKALLGAKLAQVDAMRAQYLDAVRNANDPRLPQVRASAKADLDRRATEAAAEATARGSQPFRTAAGEGIMTVADRPYDGDKAFYSVNSWVLAQPDGTIVTLYAGSWRSDLRSDIRSGESAVSLYIRTGGPQPSGTPIGLFKPLADHGPLRVVGAQGRVVQLQAADGTLLAFDTVSRSFQ